MKILLMLLAIATTATAQVDHPKALRALAETEHSAGQIGSAGETGPWQLTPANRARFRGTARAQAEQLLEEFERDLPRIGMPVSPYTIGLAWKLGITNLEHRQISTAAVRYARRMRAAYLRQ